MENLTNVSYRRYSAPQANDPASFLLAHRISTEGRKLLKTMAEVQAGNWNYPFFWCALGSGVVVLGGGLYQLGSFNTFRERLVALSYTAGLLALPAIPGLIFRAKRDQIMNAYGLDTTKGGPREQTNALVKGINTWIKALTGELGEANFTPLQFENERIYYEQVLLPYLDKLFNEVAEADINKGIINKSKKLKGQLPSFEALVNYDLSDLKTTLEAIASQQMQQFLPGDCKLTLDRKEAILTHLGNLRELITETQESTFGQLYFDRDKLSRLVKDENLPGPRPTLEFELQRLAEQPRYSDAPLQKSKNFLPHDPATFTTAHRISKKGSALYGNATAYQYFSWRSARNWGVLLAPLLTYAAYRIWKVGPIMDTLVGYGIEHPPSDIRWVYMFFPTAGALGAAAAIVIGQRNMWKIEKESPWATTEYPQWLSEIGLRYAESYLRAQATLAATSAFEGGEYQFTPKHIEALRTWYETKDLAEVVPFDQLADDATQRTKLFECVKAVVKRVKESPFGYCSVTETEWYDLTPLLKF